MAPKRKSKATGSDDPEPVRVVKLKWRSPFDNALKEGKFKIKQSDDNVRMSAVAECISRVEAQGEAMVRIWLGEWAATRAMSCRWARRPPRRPS